MAQEIKSLDPAVLASISNLELRAKFAVEGFLSGLHRSPYRGFSVDFSEYRHYHPGDDIRHIDWKLFARSGEHYIKQYEEETNVRCYIFLDCSASMGYGSAEVTKLEYSRTLASALAYFMIKQRDAVGLITFDHKIMDYLPSRYRQGHLMHLLRALANIPLGEQTNLSRPITDLAVSFQRKSLIILISDLLDDPESDDRESIIKGLQHLRFKGNDIIVFHVLDPAELTFPFDRYSEFEDVESHEVLKAAPHVVREAYLKELENFCEFYRRKCQANGIDYSLLNTAEPLNLALSAYLSKRAKSF
jgi:uncharacterized protein (DUF58 family)